jgi:hypothetical protein
MRLLAFRVVGGEIEGDGNRCRGGNMLGIAPLANMVCEALFTTRPTKKVQQIGLYDIVSKLDQDDRFTMFMARHRFIQPQLLTVLKAHHLDVGEHSAQLRRELGTDFE